MRAGTMRRRITIQKKTVTQDGIGGETVTWADYATVWGWVEPMAQARYNREFFSSDQIVAERSALFHIRYRTDITFDQTMRIVYRSLYWNIGGIINVDDRNRELILVATQGLDQG